MKELCIQWRSFDTSVTASTNYSRIIKSVSAYADCIRLIYSLTAFAYYIRFAIPLTGYTTCILKAATLFSLATTRESQRRHPISVLLQYTKTKRCPGLGSIPVRPSICLSFFLCVSISLSDRPIRYRTLYMCTVSLAP